MLIVTRKRGESIAIGEDIRVTLFEVAGQCKIGIDAPKHVKILRNELEPKNLNFKAVVDESRELECSICSRVTNDRLLASRANLKVSRYPVCFMCMQNGTLESVYDAIIDRLTHVVTRRLAS